MAGALIAGVRLSIIAAWGCVVLVEWFGSNEGAGFRARDWYQSAADYNGLMAWGVVVLVVVIVVDRGVIERIDRRAHAWRGPDRLVRSEAAAHERAAGGSRTERGGRRGDPEGDEGREGVPASDEESADGPGPGRPRLRDERADVRLDGRSVGVREEHVPQHRVGHRDADVGSVIRHRRRRWLGEARLRVPGSAAAAVAHRDEQPPLRPSGEDRRDPRRTRAVHRHGRPEGVRAHVSRASVRRHAAAGRDRPRVLRRARPAADGRAVQPSRRDHGSHAAGGAPGDLGADEEDRPVRDARRAGGGAAVEPHHHRRLRGQELRRPADRPALPAPADRSGRRDDAGGDPRGVRGDGTQAERAGPADRRARRSDSPDRRSG